MKCWGLKVQGEGLKLIHDERFMVRLRSRLSLEGLGVKDSALRVED